MSDAIAEFVRLAESGSRAAFRPLAEALTESPELAPRVAALLESPFPAVVAGAANALRVLAEVEPVKVAPFADALVAVAEGGDAKARDAAFDALGVLAQRVPASVAPGIPLFVQTFQGGRRAQARAAAALCLARAGLAPDLRPRVLPAFVEHFRKNPRDRQARDILVAVGELAAAQDLSEGQRAELASALAPLRGHPNLQVRERAGRLWRSLGSSP